nr:MAG TPA: hypothetical protein [Caudoviricetes sp.]
MPVIDHLVHENLPILPLHSASIDDVVPMEDYITPHTSCMTIFLIPAIFIN